MDIGVELRGDGGVRVGGGGENRGVGVRLRTGGVSVDELAQI